MEVKIKSNKMQTECENGREIFREQRIHTSRQNKRILANFLTDRLIIMFSRMMGSPSEKNRDFFVDQLSRVACAW